MSSSTVVGLTPGQRAVLERLHSGASAVKCELTGGAQAVGSWLPFELRPAAYECEMLFYARRVRGHLWEITDQGRAALELGTAPTAKLVTFHGVDLEPAMGKCERGHTGMCAWLETEMRAILMDQGAWVHAVGCPVTGCGSRMTRVLRDDRAR